VIHLICGSTGAGKTTYATGLRQQLGALHLSIDDWMVTLFAPDKPAQRTGRGSRNVCCAVSGRSW
jgi:predicted kinase